MSKNLESFIYFYIFILLLHLNEGLKQFLTTVCYLLHQNWGILLENAGSRILAIVVDFFQIIAIVAEIQAHVMYDEATLSHFRGLFKTPDSKNGGQGVEPFLQHAKETFNNIPCSSMRYVE